MSENVIVKLRKLWEVKQNRYAFFSACIVMIISHIYTITSILTNHDTINYYLTGESREYYIGCGRWMLYLLTKLSGTQILAPVIVLISVFSMAASSFLFVTLFHIKKKSSILLLNFIMVTFPAVANSFCYMYNADGIFLSYFFSIFCVWLYQNMKNKKGSLVICVLLILTCGTYQLYWCMSVAVMYLYLLINFYKGRWTVKKLLNEITRVICIYGSSIIGYYIVNKIVLYITDINAAGYAGLDHMLNFGGIHGIINSVITANLQIIDFYFGRGGFIARKWMICLNLFLLGYIIYKYWVGRRNLGVGCWILFLGMNVLFPSIINCVSIAGKGYIHSVMMMPFVLPYLYVIILLDDSEKKEKAILNKTCFCILILIGYSNLLTCNKVYARQELNYEVTYAYLNRMLVHIEECEAYGENINIPVCFINETPQDKNHISILTENYPEIYSVYDECNDMVGCNVRTMVKNTKDIYDFYKIFMGIELTRVEQEKMDQISNTKEFEEMKIYPHPESIQVIDGILTVKIADAIVIEN